jgi:ribokinase
MARVVVFGSSNTDMIVCLPRLPVAGRTVLGRSFTKSPGGKGANQAVAARRAGGEVVFVSAVGDDDLGRRAVEGYREEGIQVDHIRVVAGTASGVALIFVDEAGENMIGVAPGANQRIGADEVDSLPGSLFRAGDVLLVGLEVPLDAAIRMMERGRRVGMTVVLNPAPAPSIEPSQKRALLACADVVTPNRDEALALAGLADPGSDPAGWQACIARLFELGAQAAAITMGADGCLVASRPDPGEGIGIAVESIPAPRVEAVDTVGAGDAFNGALAVALGEGRSLPEAAAWACAAAALAVTQSGAQSALPRRESIDKLVGIHAAASNSA